MAAVSLAPASAIAQSDITIDTLAGTITIDGTDAAGTFRGTSYTFDASGGLATFRFFGDLVINSGDTVRGVGPNAVSFQVGNNALIGSGATFDFSASGAQAGPGGGGGGDGGAG